MGVVRGLEIWDLPSWSHRPTTSGCTKIRFKDELGRGLEFHVLKQIQNFVYACMDGLCKFWFLILVLCINMPQKIARKLHEYSARLSICCHVCINWAVQG